MWRVEIVPISILLEAFGRDVEPARHAQAKAKRGQFQQRQIERATVEADERRTSVFVPAAPEMFRDHVRPKLRFIQNCHVQQPVVGGNLSDRHRHGDVKRVGNKVVVVLIAQFLAIALDGRHRFQVLARIANLGDQLPVGDALDVEGQIAYACIIHPKLLVRRAGGGNDNSLPNAEQIGEDGEVISQGRKPSLASERS